MKCGMSYICVCDQANIKVNIYFFSMSLFSIGHFAGYIYGDYEVEYLWNLFDVIFMLAGISGFPSLAEYLPYQHMYEFDFNSNFTLKSA